MRSIFAQLVSGALKLFEQPLLVGPDRILVYAQGNEAELNRVNQYLDDNDLKHPPMEFTFEELALAAVPLQVGLMIIRVKTGWKYTIRHIDAPEWKDGICYIKVLAVTITGK